MTISPVAGVATRDIDFYVVCNLPTYASKRVSVVVPLRKGDTSAVGELYIPAAEAYRVSFHTEIDGDLIAGLDDFARYSYSDFTGNYLLNMPKVVFASSAVQKDSTVSYIGLSKKVNKIRQIPQPIVLGDEFPDLSGAQEVYELNGNGNQAVTGGRTALTLNGLTTEYASAISLNALPSRWFGYEGLDMLVLSLDDLKLLARNYPGKLLAVERWVASSGTLVVTGCGTGLSNAETAIQVFGEKVAQQTADRIAYPSPRLFEQDNATAQNATTNPYSEITSVRKNRRLTVVGSLDDRGSEESKSRLLAAPFHQGKIVCVSDEGADWAVKKLISENGWLHLVNFTNAIRVEDGLSNANSAIYRETFSGLGFPEFAEPPRYLFETSILLYLIAIGPVAFFVLKKRKQLNLLFVVVPAFSAVCCFLILLYAVFAEGFATRVNVVTVSHLDQSNDKLTTSSVTHVYAGLSPGSYRIDGSNYGFVNMPYNGRRVSIQWRDNSEEISGGEIRARTNHQIFTRGSSESKSGLSVKASGDDGNESVSVQNGFASTLQFVCFKTPDCSRDEFWVAQDVAAGGSAAAEKVHIGNVQKIIKSRLKKQLDQTVFVAGGSLRPSSNRTRTYYYGEVPDRDVDDSEFAVALSSLKLARASWIRSQTESDGGKGYIALTESAEGFESPVAGATVEGSLNIIYGAW